MKLTKELLKSWKNSPIKFIESIWGLIPQPLICQEEHQHVYKCFGEFVKGQHITWQQWLILLAVERSLKGEAPKRISVAAGHGIGKSALLAWIIFWFLMTRKNSQIGATSPTADQMYDVLMKEIAVWHQRLPENIKPLFQYSTTHLRISESPETWFMRAKTARKEAPEAFAGLHGNNVALLADEASGVPNEIYRTGEGSLTNKDTLVILISNFTRLEGYFYDTHNSDKKNWQTFNLSSLESPIVEPDFAERIGAKYGFDSDEFRYMILGLPPKGESMIDGWLPMFSEDDITKQVADVGPFMKPAYLGVDPSGLGSNKSVWVVRDAFKAKVAATEQKSSPVGVAEKTITIAQHYEVIPANVKVDNFGIGANVGMEIAVGVHEKIHAINVGGKPKDDRFLNIKAEMYWLAREWLKKGGKLVKHPDWRQLLVIRYKRTLSGKIQVMGKEEMVKKGWDSPDCFVANTKITTPKGLINIENIKIGDQINTPFGVRKVIKTWEDMINELWTAKFSNGAILQGKGKHKIFTKRGFVCLDSLALTDMIEIWSKKNLFIWKIKKLLFGKDASIGFLKLADTFTTIYTKVPKELKKPFTTQSGNFIQVKQFLRDLLFIIKTAILSIMPLKILNLNWMGNTQHTTWLKNLRTQNSEIGIRNYWEKYDHWQVSGMEALREENGTQNMESRYGLINNQTKNRVHFVEKNLNFICQPQGSVLMLVNKIIETAIGDILRIKEFVWNVKKNLWRIGICLSNVAVESVRLDSVCAIKVFNLTLDYDNVYYANGILVNNCADAWALGFVPAEVGRETTASVRVPNQQLSDRDIAKMTDLY